MPGASGPVPEELERRFLPSLEDMATKLKRDFPRVAINTFSSSMGSAHPDPGHSLGIDCCFRYAPPEECDNVALIIGVWGLKSEPYLSDLAVSWGAGSSDACIGLDLLEYSVLWSDEAIKRIEAGLPILYETLLAALRNPPFPNEPAPEDS
ncbi:MAG TPA: hypothetical protein VHY91_06445 [Pirellulales bacterium]|jgi:hypothetical protein|nr:hypothetical protein [Pirellulales bacterium]